MNSRMVGVMAVAMILLLASVSIVSASYVSSSSGGFNHRYQGPQGSSSSNYYYQNQNTGGGYYDYYEGYRYPNQQHATKPIFKGSYGNYRYQGYANGDVRPSYFFIDYPESFNRPYFSGSVGGAGLSYGGFNRGFGGFGGYGGYSGLGISRYSPSYSYNNYGNNYYGSNYDSGYQYLGGCSYSYC